MELLRRQNRHAKEGSTPKMKEWKSYFDEWLDEWPNIRSRGSDLRFTPAVNLKEAENEYIIEAELPGLEKQDVDLTIKGNHLVMRGEKTTFDEETKKDYQHVERTYGSFYRTIPLASDADTEQISADFKNGVLEIHIGKLDESQTSNRKVEIQ